ncbi:calcium-binding protein [Devosia sp. 1566]|uniref:calcium-binding protein n=1 Tax=Devosia sp. 1566 TaxID=2499144 RepID=UPI000FD7DFD6|nr:calcium-binding protein [Devosia sp. 1566]
MRLLFAIPHYYKAREGLYGSERADPEPRRQALAATLLSLHQTFGPLQTTLGHKGERANAGQAAALDIVVCTTVQDHILASLAPDLYLHEICTSHPRLLGYECHRVLRDRLGRYDYYCFLEDDIVISDALFFRKLAWFSDAAGQDCVLQPNRFEVSGSGPVRKLYVDGPLKTGLVDPTLLQSTGRPTLQARVMGEPIHFQLAQNPHSGCFFLNAGQMQQWADQPYFLDRSTEFVGPLESAASLGIMRSFSVYKPAPGNAGFLEVEHHDRRFLEGLVKFPDGFRVH